MSYVHNCKLSYFYMYMFNQTEIHKTIPPTGFDPEVKKKRKKKDADTEKKKKLTEAYVHMF